MTKRHVDLPAGYEFISLPPHCEPVIRCVNWPECMCGDDCTTSASPRADWFARLSLAAIVLVAIGLLIAGLR
ncbi:hypothetical protein [Mesorhizobium sp. B1-1-7]|uniref:hypothetical protein n=1 Tax=Mesorhizobium sp. B1-1-7 TaxID=2589977 RepID=UPI00112DA83C|nr:hypothetical protein [Mesorhizobium sp. B1-1-7]TPN43236.1 hypothetical protein FJ978_31540 [Mesorhizobium sp. B1-1-7]